MIWKLNLNGLESEAAIRGVLCKKVFLETLAQVFSCEFCEVSMNTFFTEHLWMTACVE